MPLFTVSYSLRYDHVVQVGLEALDEDDATAKVEAAFDKRTLWDDSPAIRLLLEEWREEDGQLLTFEPVQVAQLPAPDASVAGFKRERAAWRMLALLRRVARLCPLFTVPDVDLPDDAPVTLGIDDIRDIRACVASLDGC